jgi:5,10-methylenetetrahydromethanopterin reductase
MRLMVEFWRMGPTPLPATQIGAFAQELEASGWDGLAVGENNKQPDPYAVLAVAASATTSLRLGSATAVPIRHPLLAAVAMATIQGLSGGRARFSVGRGDSAAKALQQKPMPVTEFACYLRQLRAYLRRDEVEIDGQTSTISALAVVDPSLDVPPPAIDAAATGPRMIEAAVRSADGINLAVGADPIRLAATIERIRKASEPRAREFPTLGLGCFVQVAVSDDGDLSEVRDSIRPLAMTFARFSYYDGRPLEGIADSDKPHLQAAGQVLDEKFRSTGPLAQKAGGPPGELDFFRADGRIDDAFIDRFAIVGSPELCAERLQRIIDLGVDRIYIGTRFMGTDVTEANTRRIARDVFPRLRASGFAA